MMNLLSEVVSRFHASHHIGHRNMALTYGRVSETLDQSSGGRD
jgi:hypothetical protein